MTDEFHIWDRLLNNVRKKLRNDRDGIARNLEHIKELESRNEWLQRRINENELAENVLVPRTS